MPVVQRGVLKIPVQVRQRQRHRPIAAVGSGILQLEASRCGRGCEAVRSGAGCANSTVIR